MSIIKVVSFNIRCANDKNGHSREERAPRLMSAIKSREPDVIGIQEYIPMWEPYFEEGDLINLESLKVRELILPSATTLKLYASGEVTKKFTVEANHFTLDAIQAISDADGDVVMVR